MPVFTLEQKKAMTKAQLIIERDRFMTTNPEYEKLDIHVRWRTDLDAYGDLLKSIALNGPGPNPLPPPPPPPGI